MDAETDKEAREQAERARKQAEDECESLKDARQQADDARQKAEDERESLKRAQLRFCEFGSHIN